MDGKEFFDSLPSSAVLTPEQVETVRAGLHKSMVDVKDAARRGREWDYVDPIWRKLEEMTKNFPDGDG